MQNKIVLLVIYCSKYVEWYGKMFELNEGLISRQFRILHYKEFCDLCRSLFSVRIMKCRRLWWVRHWIRGEDNACRIFWWGNHPGDWLGDGFYRNRSLWWEVELNLRSYPLGDFDSSVEPFVFAAREFVLQVNNFVYSFADIEVFVCKL